LIVVDDGSTDADVPAALDVLESDYHFQARGWKLLREPNRYLGGARNRGARDAAGKYVLFMDDDNTAKSHEVQRLSPQSAPTRIRTLV
jgi:glycosyltransferase involved in cell wall biosynthesis